MGKYFLASMIMLAVLISPVLADSDSTTISINITNNDVDWCNFQYPSTGSFETGNQFLVYAQVREAGVTEAAGQGAGVFAWIGYSETNSDPSGTGWTWISASYNVDSGDNDEYMLDLGNTLTAAGTYYVASRFSRDSTSYKYGGYASSGGGFWDGSTNVSAQYSVTVNTPPVLAAIGAQTLTEDTPMSVVLSASDAENPVDSLIFSVSGGSAATVVATVSNDTLYLTPAADYFTTDAIALTVTVEDGHGGSDNEVVNVTVINVNDAPVIAAITDQTGAEGAELTFDLSASDVDHDTLIWSSANLPSGASFTDNTDGTATFSWTPTYSQAGTYVDVQFIVNDGQGGRSVMRMAAGR